MRMCSLGSSLGLEFARKNFAYLASSRIGKKVMNREETVGRSIGRSVGLKGGILQKMVVVHALPNFETRQRGEI